MTDMSYLITVLINPASDSYGTVFKNRTNGCSTNLKLTMSDSFVLVLIRAFVYTYVKTANN